LKTAEIPEISTESQEANVGFRAHDGGGHYLETTVAGLIHGRMNGSSIDLAIDMAKEVQNVESRGWREGLWRHEPMLKGGHNLAKSQI
jgi:hypothetical protein